MGPHVSLLARLSLSNAGFFCSVLGRFVIHTENRVVEETSRVFLSYYILVHPQRL